MKIYRHIEERKREAQKAAALEVSFSFGKFIFIKGSRHIKEHYGTFGRVSS